MGTSSGQVVTYLAALPAVWGAQGGRVAQLTSLTEVTVTDVATRHVSHVHVAAEPAFCALGPGHLAVGINNQVGLASWAAQACLADWHVLG